MEGGNPAQPESSDEGIIIREKRKRLSKRRNSIRTWFTEPPISSSEDERYLPSTSAGLTRTSSEEVGVRRQQSPSAKKKRDYWTSDTGSVDVDIDHLLESNIKEGSTSWIPEDPYSIAFDQEEYREFDKIAMTVHLHEYFQLRTLGEFIPKPMIEECISDPSYSNIYRDLKGVCFRIHHQTEPIDTDHNKYGNVSLVLRFAVLMQYFKLKNISNIYFAEIYQSPTHCISRFVITSDNIDVPKHFTPFKHGALGGAWLSADDVNKIAVHKFPTVIRRYKSTAVHPVKHDVEFFLDLRQEFYRELLVFVEHVPLEHKFANDDEPNVCLKYRSGNRADSSECPSPFSRPKTKLDIMEESRLETLALYVSWRIEKRTEEKLSQLNYSDDLVDQFCRSMADSVRKVTMKKTREMCSVFIGNIGDRIDNQEPLRYTAQVQNPTEPSYGEEHIEIIRIVYENVDKYINDMIGSNLDQQSLYVMAASGKMEIELAGMVDVMLRYLYGRVQDCIPELVHEMRTVLTRETDLSYWLKTRDKNQEASC